MYTIIVGGGQVGSYLGSMLLAAGHRVKIIEARKEILAHLEKEFAADVIVDGSGSDPKLLEAQGVRSANVVAAVTGADEVNLVVSGLARFEFQVPRTIARVNNPKNAWLFTAQMGVDVALNQADLLAHLIAEEMSLGDMITLLKLRKGKFSLIEEKVDPASLAAGKALKDLDLPKQCVVAGIIRKGELIIPRGDTVLQPVDEILAVVHAEHMLELAAILGRPK
jgi:trk system potassium uptake protein TrkA